MGRIDSMSVSVLAMAVDNSNTSDDQSIDSLNVVSNFFTNFIQDCVTDQV